MPHRRQAAHRPSRLSEPIALGSQRYQKAALLLSGSTLELTINTKSVPQCHLSFFALPAAGTKQFCAENYFGDYKAISDPPLLPPGLLGKALRSGPNPRDAFSRWPAVSSQAFLLPRF